MRSRCPHCEQRCPGYDRPNRPRQWRHLDMGGMRCFVQASVSRIRCPEHGVVTEMVPWARPAANMTRAFDDNVAWLAAHSPATSVCEYARVAWRSVTRIVTRVVDDAVGRTDRLQGL
ncbi:helix-turn-helix domain-containing protein, partial [Rhodococcus sp. NPDC019616]